MHAECAPPSRIPASVTQVWGIAGYSGSGKTTLISRLVPAIRALGRTVSTIKQANRGFDLDCPGKDSFRHREAGAAEVAVVSSERWAILRELRGTRPPAIEDVLRHMTPVDIVLVEGFRHEIHRRIEIYDPALGRPPQFPDDPLVVAVATDEATLATGWRPRFGRGDVEGIAQLIVGGPEVGRRPDGS